MAKSAAERQRERRQRMKDEKRRAVDVASSLYPSGEFARFMEAHGSTYRLEVEHPLDAAGIVVNTPLDIDDDPYWQEASGTPNRGAIGRAERMVDALVDSAKALAELINTYKLREIDRAIAELKARKPKTKAEHEKALADAVRLNAIRTELGKQVRHSFHQTAVKGDLD